MDRSRMGLVAAFACALVAALALGSVRSAVAGGAGCHSVAITSGAGVAVEVRGFCYEPTVLRIAPGQTVEWTNRDATAHTVSGVNTAWGDFSQFGEGESIRFSFDAAGVFPYFCALHPAMIGAVVVGDPGATDPVLAPAETGSTRNLLWLAPVVLASLAAGAFVRVTRPR